MSAVLKEVDHDAIRAELRRLQWAIYIDERDTVLAALRAANKLANEAMNRTPDKFHAPLVALMQIAQDAERSLLAGKRPRAYWISDEAEALKYFRTTERLDAGVSC